ncbi:MAG TPA: TolC family protein [Polyangiales bacterium]|nr:TolC family protein [Polyangiales bacterium]
MCVFATSLAVAQSPADLPVDPAPVKQVSLLSPEQVAASAPIAPQGEAVNLGQAIDEALRREPRVEVALQEIARAEALLGEARAGWLPTLTGNGVYTRLDHDRIAGTGARLQADSVLQLNANLNVPLVAPRGWVNSKHAKMSIGVARAASDEARRQVVLAVARTYLSTIAQQRVIEVDQRAVDNARAHHEFARQRFAGGIGNELDEVRANQEVALAEAQLENARGQLALSQEALGVLLGRDGPVDATAPESIPTGVEKPAEEMVSTRSDVRAQRGRVELAERTVTDTWADYMPTLNATFMPFFQDPPTVQYPKTGWQAQLLLSVPFYDGGLRRGQLHERKALAAAARVQFESLMRAAKSEVRAAFSTMVQADKSLAAAARGAGLARRALQMANLAYRAGATTDIEVIDAERRSRDAETSAVQAEDAARRARLELLVSTGQLPDRPTH